MGKHLIDGEFQSDKYPETPRGLVPLKCTDETAQDLLWEYAQRCRKVDAEFSNDLEEALRLKGYCPLDEYDCGDSNCETHHSQCAKGGECWHSKEDCKPVSIVERAQAIIDENISGKTVVDVERLTLLRDDWIAFTSEALDLIERLIKSAQHAEYPQGDPPICDEAQTFIRRHR